MFQLFIRTPALRLLVWVSITRHFQCSIATSALKGSFWQLQHIHVHVKEEELGGYSSTCQ